MSIKESGLRVALSVSSPLLLAAIAAVMWMGGGLPWVVTILFVVAALLAGFVLFDFALSIHVGDTGISRRCLARSQELEWSDIDKLVKKRRGLVAVTAAGRHHILIDRKLRSSELDIVRAGARAHQVQFDG
jgi:hypothetical protein